MGSVTAMVSEEDDSPIQTAAEEATTISSPPIETSKPSLRPPKDAQFVPPSSMSGIPFPDENEMVLIIDKKPRENATSLTAIVSEEDDPPIQTAAEEATTISSSPIETSKLDIATVFHNKFKPLWLGASDGWNGGSHSDAVAFCKSIRDKKLCPYSAMCPHGPGGTVMGGRHAVTFNVSGEQYAPVLGGENHWVLIGVMEENGKNVCKTHHQLQGSAPEWGVNENRKELKQHIMCCTVETSCTIHSIS